MRKCNKQSFYKRISLDRPQGRQAAGFTDCKKSDTLKKASLYDIAKAPHERTATALDSKGYEYIGDLCYSVKGLEQYQFIIVQLLKPVKRGSDISSTSKMLIYAKEVEL